jgi:hypothetical protein
MSCTVCDIRGFCEACKREKKAVADTLLAFAIDEDPIWIPIGDESGDLASDLALTGEDGRVLLDDKGAWLMTGVRNYGDYWVPAEVNLILFQVTESTSRKCIFKHYNKKEVETLAVLAIGRMCRGGSVPDGDLSRMMKDGTFLVYAKYLKSLE